MKSRLFSALNLLGLALVPEASFTLWSAGSYRSLVDSALNPGNSVLHLPQFTGTAELRSDLKLSYDSLTFVARPKALFSADRVSADGVAASTDSTGDATFTEVFLNWNVTSKLGLTYGLQNFQWGPAEAASPSNRIFRETVQLRDVLYDVKGHHLLRINFTPERDWTEVFMFEITGSGEPEFEVGEEFTRKALIKSEYAWSGGENYAGLVTGWRAGSGFWVGEYLNIKVTDGLSAYLDASHQRGSLAWYPTQGFAQSRRSGSRVFTFAVGGLRYAFENGNDLRAEWAFQEAGYTNEEINAAWTLVKGSPAFFAYSQQTGIEFPGRHYGLLSLRVPDAFSVKDWTIYGRCLASAQDASIAGYLSSEIAVSPAGTVFGAFLATGGRGPSELRGVLGTAVTLGYRHAW